MRYSKPINKLYYDRLKQISGQDKIKQAFDLNQFVIKIAEADIHNQFPNISKKELKEKLKQRLPYYDQCKLKIDL